MIEDLESVQESARKMLKILESLGDLRVTTSNMETMLTNFTACYEAYRKFCFKHYNKSSMMQMRNWRNESAGWGGEIKGRISYLFCFP